MGWYRNRSRGWVFGARASDASDGRLATSLASCLNIHRPPCFVQWVQLNLAFMIISTKCSVPSLSVSTVRTPIQPLSYYGVWKALLLPTRLVRARQGGWDWWLGGGKLPFDDRR